MTINEAIARDGGACVWCGREVWRRDMTLEHLLPRSRGGRGIPENLTVACRSCNRRRRSKAVVAYVRERARSGGEPRTRLLRAALTRLSGSANQPHAEYGRRQLALLERSGVPID